MSNQPTKKIELSIVTLDPMHPYRESVKIYESIVVNAYVYEDGLAIDRGTVLFETPDPEQNKTVTVGNGGTNGLAFNIEYVGKKSGTHLISVTALGMTETIAIEVIE
jgi:hypothetical protein